MLWINIEKQRKRKPFFKCCLAKEMPAIFHFVFWNSKTPLLYYQNRSKKILFISSLFSKHCKYGKLNREKKIMFCYIVTENNKMEPQCLKQITLYALTKSSWCHVGCHGGCWRHAFEMRLRCVWDPRCVWPNLRRLKKVAVLVWGALWRFPANPRNCSFGLAPP